MALVLPSAPKNFYEPSLNALRDALQAENNNTKGQVSLIIAVPEDIENAWAEVGAGNPDIDPNNRGTYCIGSAPLADISLPQPGPQETPEEVGYKLQFSAVPEVKINIDGSGTTLATIVGVALLVGQDTFASGNNEDVRYIANLAPLEVRDGSSISLPGWELIINYAEDPLDLPAVATMII